MRLYALLLAALLFLAAWLLFGVAMDATPAIPDRRVRFLLWLLPLLCAFVGFLIFWTALIWPSPIVG